MFPPSLQTRACLDETHPMTRHHHTKDGADMVHKTPSCPDGCWETAYSRDLAHLSNSVGAITKHDLAIQRLWSKQTFGPGERTGSVLDHIRKELVEIEAKPHDIEEWVDVIILAMDGAWRHGASPEELLAAIHGKWQKNRGRVWPDWREVPEGRAVEHDRSRDVMGGS